MRLLARPDVEKLGCATGGPLSPMLLLPSLQASAVLLSLGLGIAARLMFGTSNILESRSYPCIQHGQDGPRPSNVTDEMLKCGARCFGPP